MSARFPRDPTTVIEDAHAFIGLLAHRCNRAGTGFFDRLDAALGDGASLNEHSLPLRQLRRDAATLRALADSFDERGAALSGAAPRLRLLAAE
jgi:hypothetical protein